MLAPSRFNDKVTRTTLAPTTRVFLSWDLCCATRIRRRSVPYRGVVPTAPFSDRTPSAAHKTEVIQMAGNEADANLTRVCIRLHQLPLSSNRLPIIT